MQMDLGLAVQYSHYDEVKKLLEMKADPNEINEADNPMIQKATSLDIVELLVKHGANVSTPNQYGNTYLHWTQDRDILKFLLENGADTEIQNRNGRTPYQQHVFMGRLQLAEMIKDFVDNGDILIKAAR